MPGTSNFLSSYHRCSDCLHPIEYVIWTWNFVKDRWRTLNDARPKWVQVGCSNYLKRTATSQVQIWSPIANGPCSVCIVIHSMFVLQVQNEMTSTNTFIDITRYMPSTPPPSTPNHSGDVILANIVVRVLYSTTWYWCSGDCYPSYKIWFWPIVTRTCCGQYAVINYRRLDDQRL